MIEHSSKGHHIDGTSFWSGAYVKGVWKISAAIFIFVKRMRVYSLIVHIRR